MNNENCYHDVMNVSLSPELESLINSKVESGMYNSASEVVRAGLRLIQERDELHQKKLAALRSDIQVGLDDIEAGRILDGPEAMAARRERLLKMRDDA
jgi:antitoxin ParD1/3/4